MTRFTIKVPVYRAEVRVTIGGTVKEWSKRLRKFGVPEDDGDCDGRTEWSNERAYVWLAKPDPDCIAHEMVHAAAVILDTRGVPVSYENDESLAYLTGYLVGAVHARVAQPPRAARPAPSRRDIVRAPAPPPSVAPPTPQE